MSVWLVFVVAFFFFYSNSCPKTAYTLIRCHILQHLIWVYTVCQCPFYGTLSINGLNLSILKAISIQQIGDIFQHFKIHAQVNVLIFCWKQGLNENKMPSPIFYNLEICDISLHSINWYRGILFSCLCWGFMVQLTQRGYVERGQFT